MAKNQDASGWQVGRLRVTQTHDLGVNVTSKSKDDDVITVVDLYFLHFIETYLGCEKGVDVQRERRRGHCGKSASRRVIV